MSEEVYEVNNALENEVLLITFGDRMSRFGFMLVL
jgi:hypothetical protein